MLQYWGNSYGFAGIVTSGLVLYVDAGRSSSYPGSGNTWVDLSGNGNNGTLVNGPAYSSSNGGFLSFNGVNQYVTFSYVQPAYLTTTSFTWDIWVNPVVNSDPPLMGCRSTQTDLNFTKLSSNNFEYYDSGNAAPSAFGGLMPLNVWQNICIVKNQTNFYYFRNTGLVVSRTLSNTKPSKPFFIGGDPIGTEYSTSKIASVKVYNRALSASEISRNFDASRNPFNV